jgi:hypothetical protein
MAERDLVGEADGVGAGSGGVDRIGGSGVERLNRRVGSRVEEPVVRSG